MMLWEQRCCHVFAPACIFTRIPPIAKSSAQKTQAKLDELACLHNIDISFRETTTNAASQLPPAISVEASQHVVDVVVSEGRCFILANVCVPECVSPQTQSWK